MPKHKSSKKADASDSDSGPEDRVPAAKKAKQAKPSGDAEEDSWDLGRNRFVKLSQFKGKWYVNIREYYDADGELKPTKKGIMLTMEQWQKFKSNLDDIDETIKKRV